ncbi:hypothetical protein [Polycladomyces subterraneus]|uniref:Uncharacterized protein n=1 Tax=Polycladomyces subterraneus TaxID=1016997 RepID=A0ABT8IJX8_9BACL|nr:hypothetical protein [Polycladomyces subterraneus]MDN4593066.1 hypothetical protein [Polycladomyces subterraneus]
MNPDISYSFEPFVEKRERLDFYRDDSFLQKLVLRYGGEKTHEQALVFSPKVSYRWNNLVDRAIRSNPPELQHYDAFNRRVDRLVRPYEIEILEKEVFSEALFSEKSIHLKAL